MPKKQGKYRPRAANWQYTALSIFDFRFRIYATLRDFFSTYPFVPSTSYHWWFVKAIWPYQRLGQVFYIVNLYGRYFWLTGPCMKFGEEHQFGGGQVASTTSGNLWKVRTGRILNFFPVHVNPGRYHQRKLVDPPREHTERRENWITSPEDACSETQRRRFGQDRSPMRRP